MSPTKAIYVMTGIQKGGITNILSIENNQNSDFNKDMIMTANDTKEIFDKN